jgi:hypoxanthine phosphoribosyltransferase
LKEDFSAILIAENAIKKRVKELGEEITAHYRSIGAEELVIVTILRGAVIFMSDLVRKIGLPVTIDFMSVSSYGGQAVTSGNVEIKKDISEDIKDKHVLIVEDIIDTGLTMDALKKILSARGPKSLKVCSFLNKPSRREIALEIDFIGFDVPDEFLVGYGMDYAGSYRGLPYVAILDQRVYK